MCAGTGDLIGQLIKVPCYGLTVHRIDYVKKCGGKWCVYSKAGELLGKHETMRAALRQLRAIEATKGERDAIGCK